MFLTCDWVSSSEIHVGSEELEECDEFCYLGSNGEQPSTMTVAVKEKS